MKYTVILDFKAIFPFRPLQTLLLLLSVITGSQTSKYGLTFGSFHVQ